MKILSCKRRSGFTLLELMVVVAIIAILASILVPNFLRARAQSQLAGCESNLKNLATAMGMYNTDNNGYPTTSAVIDGSYTQLVPRYVGQPPTCPSNKSFYTMAPPVNPFTNYTIFQTGSAVHNPLTDGNAPSGCTYLPCYTSSTGLAI